MSALRICPASIEISKSHIVESIGPVVVFQYVFGNELAGTIGTDGMNSILFCTHTVFRLPIGSCGTGKHKSHTRQGLFEYVYQFHKLDHIVVVVSAGIFDTGPYQAGSSTVNHGIGL
jgi:hypothetical protein